MVKNNTLFMPRLFEIFWIFLKLGFTSFGGPAAHLVFFKQTFVEQKNWLNEQQYAQLLALTQLLPGPSSSQMGMAIGFLKQSYSGAIVAWIGFTLPSVLLMACCAVIVQQHAQFFDSALFSTLQSILLAIIIFAFWQMFKSYCKTKFQFTLMCLSTVILILITNTWIQFALIFTTGIFSLFITHHQKNHQKIHPKIEQKQNASLFEFSYSNSYIWLIIFLILFFALWLGQLFTSSILLQSSFDFYKTGSLVFGGGHVVLPMLQQDFVNTGLINHKNFELGYMLAQFMPGPLFTFTSYLGAFLPLTDSTILNIGIATIAIFIPSFFFIFAALPYWSKLLENIYIQNMVTYINAVVVGFILSIIVPMAEKSLINIQNILYTFLMLLSLKLKISVFISVPAILLIHYLSIFIA